jgi:ADP-heptose:LPS heptosyltransferase
MNGTEYPRLGERPRILVIRRDNIGDLVCTTPLIAALRERYPAAFLAALVNSYNAGVLDGNPDLNAVYTYTKLKHREAAQSWSSAVVSRVRLLAALRRKRFDTAVLAKSGFDLHGLQLARIVSARHVVGFSRPGGRPVWGITLPVPPAPADELHEVDVLMRLARALGVDTPPGPLRAFPSSAGVAAWQTRLAAQGWQKELQWVGLHISAREPSRRWPAERFVELIDRLGTGQERGFLLLWAPGTADDSRHPGDDAKAATILGAVRHGIPVLPAPTARLEDLTASLSLCQAFIGADGGAMHLAAALRLPIVALFENLPYKWRHWHPWQVPYELVAPRTRDVADITVDRVVEAWGRLALTPTPVSQGEGIFVSPAKERG